MLKFNVVRNSQHDIEYIETSLHGYNLLSTPLLNKGCAFSNEERDLFSLKGLLPYYSESLADQVNRVYAQYLEHLSDLGKNIYLNVLQDYNETLFFKLVSDHLEEMLPIIYTPVVGKAVENFSLELRKPRGIYLSYQDREHIAEIIDKVIHPETQLIVVSDGEAVLGIGDQGIGGIKICNAKLMVYTLCGGINPYHNQSIQLDVGTNNQRLLSDPMYLGWRHERISGKKLDDFIHLFVTAIKKKLPYVYLHWEDFGRDNARRILNEYREDICTINGDIQSTGTVALASVLAGCLANDSDLTAQRIVIFGAGTAGVGVADQICAFMQRQGLSPKEAQARLWLIDKEGLLLKNKSELLPFQKPYAHSLEDINDWQVSDKIINLLTVVQQVKPTILIGASAQSGAFSEEVIKTMAKYVKKPIIMPLSNPNLKSEAMPDDILQWTNGNALIATGSPFPDVTFHDQTFRIAQSNNALAFPGIGLGAIAMKAKKLSDGMLWAAAEALSQCSPVLQDKNAPLLPKLSSSLAVSYEVALAVAEQAQKEGLAQNKMEIKPAIRNILWDPKYYPYKKEKGG